MVGAISMIGPESPLAPSGLDGAGSKSHESAGPVPLEVHGLGINVPFACTPILGRSVLERSVDELKRVGVDAITLLADNALASVRVEVDRGVNDFPLMWMDNAWDGVSRAAKHYQASGIDWVFILRSSAYAEIDFLGMLHFHREQHRPMTRAWNEEGPLDVWVVDTAHMAGCEGQRALAEEASQYQVTGHVNRLKTAKDFRQLVVDGLASRFRLRPSGSEIRPGVWIEQGAQVHRRARIVGPAFVGRNSKIGEQCLITRCSNVERNCEVDYGTVVEDSSVLANSYVGIGLDVSHSIVNGSMLLNVERGVTLEIADPGMIRRTKVSRRESSGASSTELFLMSEEAFTPGTKDAD